jgi:hypothetical protein
MSSLYGLAAVGAAMLASSVLRKGSAATAKSFIPKSKDVVIKKLMIPPTEGSPEELRDVNLKGKVYSDPIFNGWALAYVPDDRFGYLGVTPGYMHVHLKTNQMFFHSMPEDIALGTILFIEQQMAPGTGARKDLSDRTSMITKLQQYFQTEEDDKRLIQMLEDYVSVPSSWTNVKPSSRPDLLAAVGGKASDLDPNLKILRIPSSPYTGPLASARGGFLWEPDLSPTTSAQDSMVDVYVVRGPRGDWRAVVDQISMAPGDSGRRAKFVSRKAVAIFTDNDPRAVGAKAWAFKILSPSNNFEKTQDLNMKISKLSKDKALDLYAALFSPDGLPLRVPNPSQDSLLEPPFTLTNKAKLLLAKLRLDKAGVSGDRAYRQLLDRQRAERQAIFDERLVASTVSAASTQQSPLQRERTRRKAVPASMRRGVYGPLGQAYVELRDGVWYYVSDDGTLEIPVSVAPRAPEEQDLYLALVEKKGLDEIEASAKKRGSSMRRGGRQVLPGDVCDHFPHMNVKALRVQGAKAEISYHDPNSGRVVRWVPLSELTDCRTPKRR